MIGIGVVGLAGIRHFRRHPLQLGLAVMGIALGVALAVGIDVANVSVRRAFALSSASVTGRTTHQILGGPTGVDQAVYQALRRAPDRPRGLALAPFVGGVGVPEGGGGLLQILGVDLFAEGPFRGFAIGAHAGPQQSDRSSIDNLSALLLRPGAALMSSATAARLGVATGGAVRLRLGARRAALTVVGLLAPPDEVARRALEGVAIVDIATAQELTATLGRLSHVDLILPSGAGNDAVALSWLRQRLSPGLRIEAVAARGGALAQMTRAFDLNLTALSLLGLLVGGFLIYNTMSFSVIQRRRVLAILRTLGVTRGQLARNLLWEALALGLVGSGLGLLLGVWLSRSLVRLTARAISDLYFAVSVTEVPIAWPPLARGLGLGVLAAVVSAWPSARDAATTEPDVALHRSALEARARARTPRLALAGLLLMAVATAVLFGSGHSVPVALGALLALLTGCAGLAPAAVLVGARVASGVLGFLRGATGRIAARSIASGLSRTGVATAALALALSVTTGVSLMVVSFRRSVELWLEATLRADVYVSAPSLVSARPDAILPADLVGRLRALPGVAWVGSNRVVTVETDQGPTMLSAPDLPLDLPPGRRLGEEIIRGGRGQAEVDVWRQFAAGDGLLASEPFAYKHHVGVDDTVTVTTDRGPRAFRIAGVYRDYGSDAGALMLSRRAYDQVFDDRSVTALALYTAPGVSADQLVDQARARLTADDVVLVRSNRALRETSLKVFDRTFEITEVLRLFAVVVACFGVAGALMAVALERGRELGTLRALGATPAQVVELTVLETGVLGALAGTLAVPFGIVLAMVLVFVINQRSFGWTMPIVFDPRTLATAPLLGMTAGIVSGLFPAWRAARTSPAEALRDE
jgi:putative ABC transport system permease protein